MIKELTEHIYGWDEQGDPAIAGPPTQEEIVDKINCHTTLSVHRYRVSCPEGY